MNPCMFIGVFIKIKKKIAFVRRLGAASKTGTNQFAGRDERATNTASTDAR